MKFDRTPFSRCDKCPFSEKPMVAGRGPDAPKLVIVGEAPGEQEEKRREPFVGPAGNWLSNVLKSVGVKSTAVWKTNVIPKRPANNDIKAWEAELAINYCKRGFAAEIEYLVKAGAKVFVPTGNTALKAFGIPGTITKARGSIYLGKIEHEQIGTKTLPKVVCIAEGTPDFLIVPTYHPSYIMRGMVREEVTWASDFEKAWSLAQNGYEAVSEKFNLFPKAADVVKFCDSALRKKALVAVDIENTGGFSPYRGKIAMIGLALNNHEALVVPFLRKGGGDYWTAADEKIVREALDRLLGSGRLMFQNSVYDIRKLRHAGFKVNTPEHDTLILHHAISPELPHRLDYIVSVYGSTPYWKDVVLKSDKHMLALEDKTFRTYNARDVVVLHQVLPGLLRHLKDVGTQATYETGMKLVEPVITIMDNGLKLSVHKQNKLREELTAEQLSVEAELRSKFELPEAFNFSSDDHVRRLVFGENAGQFSKALNEYQKYMKDATKRRNTKKFAQLEGVVSIANMEARLRIPTGYTIRKTDSGKKSLAKSPMVWLGIATSNRLQALTQFVRQTEERKTEEQQLQDTLFFCERYGKLKALQKLVSTYCDFKADVDGRVHFPYRITGTATGRFASGDKEAEAGNGQNIPPVVKKIFVATTGNVLLEADYSNLELRILAYLSDDSVSITAFEKGLNIHDENTKALFGVGPEHPNWDSLRKAAKTYIFGRNYGGGIKGIFERVLEKVPYSGLTLADFRAADAAYRKAHPAYAVWYDQTVYQIERHREVSNAFGRKRFLLGSDYEIVKEGLNFPIQSTAADIVNQSLIRIHSVLPPSWRLVGSVHDSILLETPKADKIEAGLFLKGHMETGYKIGKYSVRFPVDVKAGGSWGQMTELDLAQKKPKRKS